MRDLDVSLAAITYSSIQKEHFIVNVNKFKSSVVTSALPMALSLLLPAYFLCSSAARLPGKGRASEIADLLFSLSELEEMKSIGDIWVLRLSVSQLHILSLSLP